MTMSYDDDDDDGVVTHSNYMIIMQYCRCFILSSCSKYKSLVR